MSAGKPHFWLLLAEVVAEGEGEKGGGRAEIGPMAKETESGLA